MPAGVCDARAALPLRGRHRQRVPRTADRRRRLHDRRHRRAVSELAGHRLALLRGLYGDLAESIESRAMVRLASEQRRVTTGPTQADAWLIAYADSFRQSGVAPLATL